MGPMKRIDLDDLPPNVAALLAEVEAGEEVILVKNGVVLGRLTGAEQPQPPAEPDTDADLEARAQEIFEQFRASIEDEF
jgi:antitoxin (DNA-binding transcriptional repressor) of toxin-antitoxin stability system